MAIERKPKPTASVTPSPGDVIAGWRLVRPLTQDGREFVGVAEFSAVVAEAGSEHWQGYSQGATPRLEHRRVVVASGPQETAALAADCALRDEIGSEFVELAEETLTEGELRIAVFPIRHVRTYADFVARDAALEPGQAVTALVPIVEAIFLAHRNGVSHGSVSLAVCLVDHRGRPSLDGWGNAVRLAELSAVRADITRGQDLRGLGRVVDAILSRCRVEPEQSLRQLVDALCDGVTPTDAAGRLIDALFQWAEPLSLPSSALPAESQEPNVSRLERRAGRELPLVTPDHLVETLLQENTGAVHRPSRARLPALGVKSRLLFSEIRPAIWALAGLAGLLIALGGGLLVGGMPDGSVAADPIGSEPAPAPLGTLSTVQPERDRQSQDSSEQADQSPPATAVQSVPILVSARNDCISADDIECVSDLYSTTAPGLATELAALSGADGTATRVDPDQEWSLAADLGDIQLFRGSEYGSVSLERTSDGWRLREIWLPEAFA